RPRHGATTATSTTTSVPDDVGGRFGRLEAVELLGVAPQDLPLHLVAHVGGVEALLGQLDRVGPRGVGVRVVHLDHHVVLTDHVEHAQAGGIVDEAAVEVLAV